MWGINLILLEKPLLLLARQVSFHTTKTAKLNLLGRSCAFGTCCEFEANPFRIFFYLCTRVLKKKLRRVWLQTFRYIPKGYKAWFGFLPSGLLLKLLFLQFLQEYDWKDPGELHSLCKGQQDTVTLQNFRRSCVTFAEYLLWHEDLGLGRRLGEGSQPSHCTNQKPRPREGKGLA